MIRRNLLLHSCCAPCFGHVYQLLKLSYNIASYFYNPNISPLTEYNKRFSELKKFCAEKNVNIYYGAYDAKRWTDYVKQYRFFGEKSERCWKCYEFRLEETFNFAIQKNIDIITTTLSISPHKDAGKINEIGKRLEQKYNIEFLEADFKKNDGFKKSLELSKEYGFYRQSYCGCVYSRLERNRNSLWFKKYCGKK